MRVAWTSTAGAKAYHDLRRIDFGGASCEHECNEGQADARAGHEQLELTSSDPGTKAWEASIGLGELASPSVEDNLCDLSGSLPISLGLTMRPSSAADLP